MKIIELILDEEQEMTGIEAISLVSEPAIMEHWIALKEQKFKFAEANKEKRIITGAALVPNRPIIRVKNAGLENEEQFYVYFSKSTIEKAQQLFFKNGNQLNATLEHEEKIKDVYVTESWIVTDKQNDKSNSYELNVPEGTWMISMKIDNDDIWNNYIKPSDPKILGFSIEGYFSQKFKASKIIKSDEVLSEQKLSEIKEVLTTQKITLESYNDYPQSVQNNAKRGIELNEKNNNKCASQVGKVRAATLAKKGNITLSTIKRMYSYLSRAEEYYKPNDSKACGTISYLLWGGKSALGWSRNKLKELGELELVENSINKKDQEKLNKIKNFLKVVK